MREIGVQATSIAYANDFYILALVSVLALPLAWMLRPSRQAPDPAAAIDAGGH